MTAKEYVCKNHYKPLSDVELERGKDILKIRLTNTLIPWSEIYTRLRAGMPMERIVEMYGSGRVISLWAMHDGVEVDVELQKVVINEIAQRKTLNRIVEQNPKVAKTLLDLANEYAPDVGRNVAILTSKIVNKANLLLDEGFTTTNDLVNIAKAVQTMTDTVELSKRFSNNVHVNNNTVSVSGFRFELDTPPPPIDTTIHSEEGY